MHARRVCILLTLHCTGERVDEYQRSLRHWNIASDLFRKVITVDSANNTYIKTTHSIDMHHFSRSYGEKMSILAALPSLLDCPFIFKFTARYYSDEFVSSLRSIPVDAQLVLQFLQNTRGQNSEVFGATLDHLLVILSRVRLRPYVAMESALLLHSRVTNFTRLPRLRLNFVAEQKSRHRNLSHL